MSISENKVFVIKNKNETIPFVKFQILNTIEKVAEISLYWDKINFEKYSKMISMLSS